MRVVVTGGAGFVGANLLHHMATVPEITQTVVVDDFSFGFRRNLDGLETTIHEGSILDQDLLDEAVDGADAIVHLAARSSVPRSVAHPFAAHEANATGTVRVLEAARSAGGIHVITASSSSVYGANKTLPKSENLATRPVSPYAASKTAAEAYTLAWGHSYDLPVLAFRFFNIFGPLQPPLHAYAAAIPSFLAAAFQNEPIPIHGSGTQSRDFTYVDTVVQVLTNAVVQSVVHDEPVNLAYGTSSSLLEVIALIEEVLGKQLPREHLPLRTGDVPHSQADSRLLLKLFPAIEPTPLTDGLRDTIAWFRSARPWEHASD